MHTHNLLVSVIMPVFNAQKYLRESVSSVVSQTYSNWELIIVDDGSNDDSFLLCQSMAQNDDRIRVYSQKNGGASSARNYGLKKANGALITFIDDDDVYESQFLEDGVESFINLGCDFFKCGREDIYCDTEGNIISKVIRKYHSFFEGNSEEFMENYMVFRKCGITAPVWNAMYKKDIIFDNNIVFDEQLKTGQEDISFNSRYCKFINRFVISDKVYYKHFIRSGISTSTKFFMEQLEAKDYSINMEKALLNHCYDNELEALKMIECFEMALSSADKREFDRAIKYMIDNRIIENNNAKCCDFVSMTRLRKICYVLLSRGLYDLYYGLMRLIQVRR